MLPAYHPDIVCQCLNPQAVPAFQAYSRPQDIMDLCMCVCSVCQNWTIERAPLPAQVICGACDPNPPPPPPQPQVTAAQLAELVQLLAQARQQKAAGGG